MITISNYYNGPAGRGHGGTAAGHFAAELEADGATVRFHNPVPLDTPLSVIRTATGVSIVDENSNGKNSNDENSDGENATNKEPAGGIVATVKDLEGHIRVGQFPELDPSVVDEARAGWLKQRNGQHMAPTCFACGHERSQGGLDIRPAQIGLTDVLAAVWTPPGSGRLPSWLIWSAMDCPTGFPALNHVGIDEAVVTGELSVQVLKPIPAGERYTILSRRVAGEGRRHNTEAALLSPDGERLAVATATWITIPVASMLPELVAAA